MSRFLITTMPMRGHINPTIPIVDRIQKAGHKVLWYTDIKFQPTLNRFNIDIREAKTQFPYEPVDFDLANLSESIYKIKQQVKYVFVDWPICQIEDLENIIKDFKPDIIFTD